MVGKYIITKHALQRYEQRTNESKISVQRRILRDLKALRNKKIVHVGPTKYVFYTQPNGNVREFILEQSKTKKDTYYVTTIINRTPESSKIAYEKRLKCKEEYDKNKEKINE